MAASTSAEVILIAPDATLPSGAGVGLEPVDEIDDVEEWPKQTEAVYCQAFQRPRMSDLPFPVR